ncbi:MAG: hypothetical protein A3F68_03345 [Acidobacteria bacterium RIFCSPLOWO2_12_FULL_54_10]|nr:MAG: hypothetical protein A3F68_03345 [Acidobacteria bacterium RIFCSPLOWO2_12_FULL_54_10]
MDTAAMLLSMGSAASILFSIAVSQILLGGAILTLLLSRRRLTFPARLGLPLIGFVFWTMLSVVLAPDPVSGVANLKKLFPLLIFVVVYNSVREQDHLLRLLKGVIGTTVLAGLFGFGQFAYAYWNLSRQGKPFYENYVLHQASGFMSHWLTFGAQLMLVFLLISSILFFFRPLRFQPIWWTCFVLIGLGILASFARGIWVGAFFGAAYLLARYRLKLLWLLPVLLIFIYLISPSSMKRRAESLIDLRTDSSNQSRPVMFLTGIEMIRSHPFFGLGPGRVEVEFLHYKPASLPLPHAWYGHLHNNYTQIAAERGLPCLFFFLWFFFEILRATFSWGKASSAELRTFGHAAFAITVGFLVAGLFEFNFGDSEVLMLYLFLVGAIFSWAQADRSAVYSEQHQATG